MLDYIKSVLAESEPNRQPADYVDDATILEYAHMFSELADITETGTTTGVRPPISIPLDEDFEVELDSFQYNYTDGRVTDIPTDATVSESYRIAANVMKTRDDFVQEAYSAVTRMPRESYDRYKERVDAYARSQWNAYQEYVQREGLFGYDKMKLNDSRVPDKVVLEFDGYSFTLPVRWEIDRGKNVTKKQLDSLTFWANASDARSEMVTEYAVDVISEAYRVNPNSIDFGGSMTPVSVIVPKGPTDSFAIIVEFDTEYDRKNQFMMFAAPVKGVVQEADDESDDGTDYESDDGSDVGGVDFESEGVQREERVRKATGVTTPKYLKKHDDSVLRGNARMDRKAEEMNELMGQAVRNWNDPEKRDEALAKREQISKAESRVLGSVLKTSSDLGKHYDPIVTKSAKKTLDSQMRARHEVQEPAAKPKSEYCTLVDVSDMNVARKRDFDLLVAEMSRPSRFGRSRMFLEGIDFGDGAPPAPADEQPAAPPQETGATAAAPTEEPVPTDNATAADAGATATVPAAVNDVSDQIAQNVSDQTQATAAIDNPEDVDINVDAGDTSMDVDIDNPDASIDTAVDAELDGMDVPTPDTPVDADVDVDVDSTDMPTDTSDMDNMTIDELVAQGAEKLKGMTIGQLKEFLNAPDGTTPADVQEAYITTESFFTKSGNVKQRIGTALTDVVKGLRKIVKGIEEDDWDRREFTAFWHRVKTGEQYDTDFSTSGDITFGMSTARKGEYFAETFEQLIHYVKIAVKKKRTKEAFTDDERDQLSKFLDHLKSFHRKGDTMASSIRSNDVSLDEILEGSKKLLDEADEIKPLLTSKKFTESYVFEAAVITKRNVNGEIIAHIKSTLGILNDTSMDFKQLVEAFKKEGKLLNKALTKASKMKKLFSQSQRDEIDKLNSILIDLQSNMRMNGLNTQYTNKVKRLITDFAKQSKVVGDALSGKSIQEGANCSSCPAQSSSPVTSTPPATVKEEDIDATNEPIDGGDSNVSDTSSDTPDTSATSAAPASSSAETM
jgi:hypothetical protein